jgi:hypothetical protein
MRWQLQARCSRCYTRLNARAFPMKNCRLRQLDRRTIAIEINALNRRPIVLRGVGNFELDGDFGTALRVEISDSDGVFEVVLKECEWDGRVESGERFDCEFALQLDATSLCPS